MYVKMFRIESTQSKCFNREASDNSFHPFCKSGFTILKLVWHYCKLLYHFDVTTNVARSDHANSQDTPMKFIVLQISAKPY